MKYPYICFSFHLYFLVFIILYLYLYWLMQLIFLFSFNTVFKSSYWCIYAILNTNESTSSFFFLTYCLHHHLSYVKALCIVINFIVLGSVCLSFSFVHFKNGFHYLTSGVAQVFILLIRFFSEVLFLLFFLHLRLFDGVRFHLSKRPKVFSTS